MFFTRPNQEVQRELITINSTHSSATSTKKPLFQFLVKFEAACDQSSAQNGQQTQMMAEAESNIIALDSDVECECTTPLTAKEKNPAAATQEKGNQPPNILCNIIVPIDHDGKF